MKSRNQYAKTIRRIEIGSNFLLIIGILVSFFMSWGLPGTIGTVVLYILLMAYNFTLMKRCRCDSCGHVDIFTKSRSFVTGVEQRCPNCNHKLKIDVPLNEIEFKK